MGRKKERRRRRMKGINELSCPSSVCVVIIYFVGAKTGNSSFIRSLAMAEEKEKFCSRKARLKLNNKKTYPERRACAEPNCGTILRTSNSTLYCSLHQKLPEF